jgi:hypothetical protein
VASDWNFAEGADKTSRARDLGTHATSGKPFRMPMVEIDTAIPDVIGFQNAAVTTAVALPSIPAGATHALLVVDTGGGNLRFREDATNPTTSVGLLVQAGNAVELTNLADVRIISTTGTTNVNISYRRYDRDSQ